jgi:hypothetical protein
MPTVSILAVQVEREPRQILVGIALMLVTAVFQAFSVILLEMLSDRVRRRVGDELNRLRTVSTLCGVIFFLFAMHLLEMCLWAAVYLPLAGYSSFAVSVYESALGFTSGSVADLPPAWKFLSAAEVITGLLMLAWSTAVLFNQMSWITEAHRNYLRKHHMFGEHEPETPA